jgi:phosphotransferase system HPr (HPr) family protein
MTRSTVVVSWQDGLHLRPAIKLMRVAKRFHSTIRLRCGGRVADLRSILSVVALCATMGTALDLEVTGEDEKDAAQAVERIFSSPRIGETSAGNPLPNS